MSIVSKLLGLGVKGAKQAVDVGGSVLSQGISKVLPTSEERILNNLMSAAPKILARKEGFSFDPRRGKFLDQQVGSMMGTLPNNPSLAPVQAGGGVARNVQELLQVARQPEVMSRLQRGQFLGGWDEGQGMGLDPSRRFMSTYGAIREGMGTQQAAGFKLGSGSTFDVTPESLTAARNKLVAGTAATGLTLGVPGTLSVPQARDFLTGLGREEAPVVEDRPATIKATFQPSVASAGGKALVNSVGKLATDDTVSAAIKQGKKAGSKLLNKLLKQVKTDAKKPKGSTTPSPLAKSISDKLGKEVKIVEGKTKTGKTTQTKTLVFNVKGGAKYPKELKDLGLQPITGYNYATGGAGLKKLDPEIVNEEMKNNIRAMLGVGGYRDFYKDIPGQLLRLSKDELPLEQISGISAPFSQGASVPNQLDFTRSYLANPYQIPQGLIGGNVWRRAIRSTVNENPLDPFNFSNKGNVVKVGSFARNNTNDAKFDMNVTADRHAVKNALGITTDEFMPDMNDQELYNIIVRAYNEVAQELGLTGRQVQAEAWDVWRKIMIKDAGSTDLSLFAEPGNINPLFALSPLERKELLLKEFKGQGRDLSFLEDARLTP